MLDKSSSKGLALFILLVGLVALVVLFVIGFVGFNAWQGFLAGSEMRKSGPPGFYRGEQGDGIKPAGPVQFTHDIIKLSDYQSLTPPGTVSADTFSAHGYLTLKEGIERSPIYAPTDAEVLFISYFNDPYSPGTNMYDLSLIINGDLELWFGGVTELSPKLTAVAPQQPLESSAGVDPTKPTSVEAGELLGYVVQRGWDFGAYDNANQNTVANMDRYLYGQVKAVAKYVTGVCAYNYYPEEMKQGYLNLMPGKQCPNSSRDVPGTAAGYWYADKSFNLVEDDYFYYGGVDGQRFVIAIYAEGEVQWAGVGEGTDKADVGSVPKDPADLKVGDSGCYKNDLDWIDTGNNYLFVKLLSETELAIDYGQGRCPTSFPESGFKVYIR